MGMAGVGQKMSEVPALDSTPNTIRAWTIQRTACWEQFQKGGILRGDGRRVDHYFRPAYRWLIAQMGKRLPGCEGVTLSGSGTPQSPTCATAHTCREAIVASELSWSCHVPECC